MRAVWAALVAFLLGLFVAYAVCVVPLRLGRGGGRSGSGGSMYSCNPLEVNVIHDSLHVYHVEAFQKTIHLTVANHEVVAWTFDKEAGVDSVTAVFTGASPFASSRFEFSDSAAFSGAPVVAPGATVYNYVIKVYFPGDSAIVDPGIIVE
jgi:hypothetical protein